MANIGQIGAVRIVSESGVAAGTRRIEAVTGAGIQKLLREEQALVAETAAALKTNASGLVKKAEAVTEELKAVKKELEQVKAESRSSGLADLIKNAKEVNGAKLITAYFEDMTIDELRSMSDQVKAAEKNAVMVFAALNGEKTTLMVSVADAMLEKGVHAGQMIKQIAAVCGGGGGGKADMAQAGAKDRSKLPEAFDLAEKILAQM